MESLVGEGRARRATLAALAFVLSLVYMVPAFATYDRDESRRDDSRRENLREMRELVEEGMEAAEDWSFSYALYKFKAARLRSDSLFRSPIKSQLEETLDTTIMKLRDYSLSSREKEDVVLDCGRIALDLIERLARGGHPGGGSNSRSLRQALQLMDDVVELAERYRFDEAFEQLLEIEPLLRRHEDDHDIRAAIQAVRVIEEKASDTRLSYRERRELIVDCARSFRESVERSRAFREEGHGGGGGGGYSPHLNPRNLDQAIAAVNFACDVALQNRFEEALEYIAAVQQLIGRYGYDRELRSASDVLSEIEKKLLDERESSYAKVQSVRVGARQFTNIVKRSDVYRREHGVDYSRAEYVSLGRTELFSKSRLETRSVGVPVGTKSLRALKIIARDDAVAISDVVVELAGGSRMSIGGDVTLSEGSGVILDIDFKGREIKSVHVTASSAVIWGTKGRVEVQGIR